ncbi:putative estradiol 17 beta-dehydrogenase [Stipitochalara longipes BDJ]|nr:putative estradiol 17 beta-dehydrogenase [Stipitochalara longipes BDJ]
MAPSLASTWTQICPRKPEFTEKNLLDLKGKVYIVTGSNTGIGRELARILYARNAKVYIFARSQEKALTAIEEIKATEPTSTGTLIFAHLDLSDLTKIKASAEALLAAETKLHVLFNNAGFIGGSQEVAKTSQGYEEHLGVNCLATFLFTKFLTPILISTAKTEQPNTVRVAWVLSSGCEIFAEENVCLSLDNLDYHVPKPAIERYGRSKVGSWAYGVEFAKRFKAEGIVSIPLNPGNLKSDLARDQGATIKLISAIIRYPPINGAYTELFAGLSPDVTIEKSGDWVIPWGRFYLIRNDLIEATKTKAEGGTGGTNDFWEWSEEQVDAFL